MRSVQISKVCQNTVKPARGLPSAAGKTRKLFRILDHYYPDLRRGHAFSAAA